MWPSGLFPDKGAPWTSEANILPRTRLVIQNPSFGRSLAGKATNHCRMGLGDGYLNAVMAAVQKDYAIRRFSVGMGLGFDHGLIWHSPALSPTPKRLGFYSKHFKLTHYPGT